jgi:hypothetical protein
MVLASHSFVTDYASNFDAVALAEHHKSEALRLGVTKEDHEEKERMSPPAALQLLFQKQAGDIMAVNPKRLEWSKVTQEQAQRGGRASVETHGEQMANGGKIGGRASVATHGDQIGNMAAVLRWQHTANKWTIWRPCFGGNTRRTNGQWRPCFGGDTRRANGQWRPCFQEAAK